MTTSAPFAREGDRGGGAHAGVTAGDERLAVLEAAGADL